MTTKKDPITGEDLKQRLKRYGLSVVEFSKKINTSISTVNSWLYAGIRVPPIVERWFALYLLSLRACEMCHQMIDENGDPSKGKWNKAMSIYPRGHCSACVGLINEHGYDATIDRTESQRIK